MLKPVYQDLLNSLGHFEFHVEMEKKQQCQNSKHDVFRGQSILRKIYQYAFNVIKPLQRFSGFNSSEWRYPQMSKHIGQAGIMTSKKSVHMPFRFLFTIHKMT